MTPNLPSPSPRPQPPSTSAALLTRATELDAQDPTTAVRGLSRAPAGHIRLESHTLGTPLAPVLQAPQDVLRQWTEHGVKGWLAAWSNGASNWIGIQPDQIRSQLAAVLNASPERVVVRGALSENLALALRMVGRPRASGNDRPLILTHELLFPSDDDVIRAEHEYHRRDPATSTIRVAPSLPRGLFTTEDFTRALSSHSERAGILVLEHQPYLSGQVLDIKTICQHARALGYFVIVDAAHSGGVHPIDAEATGAHLIVGCGYKEFLAGPGALGWMYADVDELRRAGTWLPRGWWGRNIESRFTFGGVPVPDTGALALQLSTPSPILQSMWAAVLKCYANAGGIHAIYQQGLQRGELFMDRLAQHPDFGTRFGILTPREANQRSAEIVLHFARAADSLSLYQWLSAPDDGGVAVDADTRNAYYDPSEGLMRFGLHPFIVSHADALHAAERICLWLDRQRQRDILSFGDFPHPAPV